MTRLKSFDALSRISHPFHWDNWGSSTLLCVSHSPENCVEVIRRMSGDAPGENMEECTMPFHCIFFLARLITRPAQIQGLGDRFRLSRIHFVKKERAQIQGAGNKLGFFFWNNFTPLLIFTSSLFEESLRSFYGENTVRGRKMPHCFPQSAAPWSNAISFHS